MCAFAVARLRGTVFAWTLLRRALYISLRIAHRVPLWESLSPARTSAETPAVAGGKTSCGKPVVLASVPTRFCRLDICIHSHYVLQARKASWRKKFLSGLTLTSNAAS